MLSTINGFDLLLIIIITVLGFKVYNLNRECLSYVEQIMKLAQELNEIHYYKYESIKDSWGKPKPKPLTYGYCNFCTGAQPVELYPKCTCKPDECLYCLGIEEFVTGNECYCTPF